MHGFIGVTRSGGVHVVISRDDSTEFTVMEETIHAADYVRTGPLFSSGGPLLASPLSGPVCEILRRIGLPEPYLAAELYQVLETCRAGRQLSHGVLQQAVDAALRSPEIRQLLEQIAEGFDPEKPSMHSSTDWPPEGWRVVVDEGRELAIPPLINMDDLPKVPRPGRAERSATTVGGGVAIGSRALSVDASHEGGFPGPPEKNDIFLRTGDGNLYHSECLPEEEEGLVQFVNLKMVAPEATCSRCGRGFSDAR